MLLALSLLLPLIYIVTSTCPSYSCGCDWANSGTCVNNDGSNCFQQCCCEKGFLTVGTDQTTSTSSSGGTGWSAGVTTRYWDCCKPSCTWPSNVNGIAAGKTTVRSCLIDGTTASPDAINICGGGGNGGPSYSCTDNQPRTGADGTWYGFVAKDGNACCQCMELEFTSTAIAGKRMVVQVTNTGGDLGSAHFDIQIPGGGFGIYNGCASNGGEPGNGPAQFAAAYSVWGQRYGGVSSVSDCDSFPVELQNGCKWRFTDFLLADNPSVNWRRVKCPTQLTDITGCILSDDASWPEPGSATVTSETTDSTTTTSAGTGTDSTTTTSAGTGTGTGTTTNSGTGTGTGTDTGTGTGTTTNSGTGTTSADSGDSSEPDDDTPNSSSLICLGISLLTFSL